MVIKLLDCGMTQKKKFESSVISYGNQTHPNAAGFRSEFESSVISYGNQTVLKQLVLYKSFESSVISYGNQTRQTV